MPEQNRFTITWVKSQDPFEMRELRCIVEPNTGLVSSTVVVACMSSHDGRNWTGQTADAPFNPCYLGDNQDECREAISTYVKHNLCSVRKCASEIKVGVWGS
jgi:hypothetical protein